MAKKLETIIGRNLKELRNLTCKELKRDLGRMRDAIHKRVARHKEAGTTPKAIQRAIESGGEISTKGKSPDELIAEYQRAQKILKAGGVREVKKKTEEKRARNRGQTLKPEKEKSRVVRIRSGWKEPKLYDVQTAYERLKKKEEREEKRRQKREAIENFLQSTKINPSDTMQKMTKEELKTIYKLLREETQKQIKRFEKMEESSPAYRIIKQNLPTRRPEDRQALLQAVARMRKFLESETGTVEKWKKKKQHIIDKLNAGGVTNINVDNFDKVFEIYEKLKETDPMVSVLNWKSDVLDIIADHVTDIMQGNEDMTALLQEYYESKQAEQQAEMDELLKLGDTSDIWDGFNPFDD